MLLRITFTGILIAAAAGAQQGPPPGRGPMGGGARFLGAQPGMPGRVVKNAPFTADLVTEINQALPDGNHIRQTSTVRMYRDSEGRTRREPALNNLGGLAPNANLPQVIFINDPVAGADYALNPSNHTATRSLRPSRGNGPMPRMGGSGRGPNPGMMRRSDGGSDSGNGRQGRGMARGNRIVKTESLGRQVIEGVPADGSRTTMTIPAGEVGNEQPIQIVSESWYSPDLQMVVLSKRSDPRSGETVVRLSSVSRAEPPRTMFDVPSDYTISDAPRGRGFDPRN